MIFTGYFPGFFCDRGVRLSQKKPGSPALYGPIVKYRQVRLPEGMGDLFERERFKTDDKENDIQ